MKVVYKMQTQKSVGIVIDKYAIKICVWWIMKKKFSASIFNLVNCRRIVPIHFSCMHSFTSGDPNKYFKWTGKP